ncbi:hypothetical protein SLA2020_513320 [Shorea laevis]
MNSPGLWKPVVVIVVVYFAYATVIVLNKKILDKGVSPVIVVTYRQAISCVFLAPLAYFWEREVDPTFLPASYAISSSVLFLGQLCFNTHTLLDLDIHHLLSHVHSLIWRLQSPSCSRYHLALRNWKSKPMLGGLRFLVH